MLERRLGLMRSSFTKTSFIHVFLSIHFLQKESEDYELNLGAKLYVDKFIQPRQKFASIIKSFYYSGKLLNTEVGFSALFFMNDVIMCSFLLRFQMPNRSILPALKRQQTL